MSRLLMIATALFLLSSVAPNAFAEKRNMTFEEAVEPWVNLLQGKEDSFEVSGTLQLPIDGSEQAVTIRLTRFNQHAFDLELAHAEYACTIRRRENGCAFALPLHKVVYLGTGDAHAEDHLQPYGILARLISKNSDAAKVLPFLKIDAATLTSALAIPLQATATNQNGVFDIIDDGKLTMTQKSLQVVVKDYSLKLKLAAASQPAKLADWSGMKQISLSRAELEQQLCRGVRRTSEVLAPGDALKKPLQTPRSVAHGELKWIDGQRVCLLAGTPEQIGTAHGQLLKEESNRCIDSVLFAFGTVQTIRTGRWFRHDLDEAYSRLEKHIPERHKRETVALAHGLGIAPELATAINVFPELFHCSGFAVFDSATVDGKLYHGRVLDYMTTIGLQDSATTFIVKPDGHHAFANIGYGGFIGSVSGMNDQQISLGEMGGRGEGEWDGVPMATLMRRALEECSTLQEVKDLWSNNPRTCEYYYVFADGKTNEAVGVAALPESVEFVQPGQTHERLGEGIPDAVVLSAGSRLEKLRERVQEKHGKIDAQTAIWLMSRPVAMKSNLHNVLFVPADGVFYVANADHKHPAAERPYVRYNLKELLNDMPSVPGNSVKTTAVKVP